jgi:hypothetical protein
MHSHLVGQCVVATDVRFALWLGVRIVGYHVNFLVSDVGVCETFVDGESRGWESVECFFVLLICGLSFGIYVFLNGLRNHMGGGRLG